MTRRSLDISDKEQHSQYFSKAEFWPDVFSPEDLDELSHFMFKSTLNWRVSDTGNLFFSGDFPKIIVRFYKQLEKLVDLTELTGIRGNFYHTPHQYGFHTDMPEKEDFSFLPGDVAYKSLLIPLYKLPRDSKCHMLFFKERLLDHGATLDRGKSKSLTHYKSYDQYEDIECLYNEKREHITYKDEPFDEDVFKKYNLGHSFDKERFSGFHLESAFEWVPGSVMVFDTTQLHCSNKGLEGQLFNAKAGLRISLWKNYLGNRYLVNFDKHKENLEDKFVSAD